MLARRMLSSLSLLGILATFATSIDAGDGPHSRKKRITASECKELVAHLINPEKPPFEKDFVLKLPKGVDEQTLRRQQAKITASYQKLSDNIEVALPVLMQKVDDERFSFVYTSTSGAITKQSVGGACLDIIVAHVEVYRRHATGGDDGVPRCLSFIYDECGGIEKWWKSRQGKPLAELQLEGIKWVLQQKKPKYFESEKEWAAAKKSLEKMAKKIRLSKKPIPAEHHPPRLVVYK